VSTSALKILVVAMSDSLHTARWVGQLAGTGWEVRLFPSLDHGVVHPELRRIPVYHTLGGRCAPLERQLRWQKHRWFSVVRGVLGIRLLPALWPQRRIRQLCRVIADFQPDIVHALEFQSAGYLTLAAKQFAPAEFPPWIISCWGSDIYWFRHFPEHLPKISEVLENCDYLACECRRDVFLAERLGLKGKVLPLLPAAGGFDLENIELRQLRPVSARRKLLLKGYQHWVGRALVGLAALEKCVDLLAGYEVIIHSPSRQMYRAVRDFEGRTGVKVVILPPGTEHRTILDANGQARIALGLSLSDGLPASFLEAMIMGAFPVQSWTSCADEWIEDGKTGLLVPPEDVDAVAAALRRALTDDALVDRAAESNAATARQRLNQCLIREQARDYYRRVADERGIPCH